MRIDLINTGTELLIGQTLNTHAYWLGDELFRLGLRIQRQVCIPDGDEIRLAVLESIPRSEIIIVTGGLGPTSDDISREVVAETLGMPLERNDELLETIRLYLSRRQAELNENSFRQAMVPHGARILSNPFGTAPGLYFPPQKKNVAGVAQTPHIFLLPGPPREIKPMWQDHVLPFLRDLMTQEPPEMRNFKLFGVGESQIAQTMEAPLLATGLIELGYCVRPGEVIVRAIGSAESLDRSTRLMREAFPENLFSDHDELMEEVVVAQLKKRGESIATAESCTGGFIAHRLTNVPGASEVFGVGFVTYANETKEKVLGVPESMIRLHGAVSESVARAMADGALRASGAVHALAVTGIAGPDGGTDEKPVGTVFIGLASKNQETVVTQAFYPYDREMFKVMTSQAALDLLRRRLS